MSSEFSLSKAQFLSLANNYNLIPIYQEIIDDFDTPVSAYLKLGNTNDSFLLESVEGGETLGRYSFIGFNPFLKLVCQNEEIVVEGEFNQTISKVDNPLKILRQIISQYKLAPVPGLPPFHGGAIGYLSYDCISYFEKIPRQGKNDLNLPEMIFLFTDVLVIFDHLKHRVKVLTNARVNSADPIKAYDKAISTIVQTVNHLRKPVSIKPLAPKPETKINSVQANMPKSQFIKAVEKSKEYIFAGDILQVVISQRFSLPITVKPFQIYRLLRTINPSPYLGFLKFKETTLIASSPEPLVKVNGSQVITRPIAGTRPRGKTDEADKALEKELLTDEKEAAEHIMLVDLGRNDLGRVCRPGTVKIDDLMFIERYSHVMHIVSQVSGQLKERRDAFDVLESAFPAGTVSGAPKIRAMEIISELEPTLRGPYAGVFGYFSFSGNLDSGITIRTIVIKDKVAYVQAGAGIVADSDPEREYQETVNKAMALIRAVKMAEAEQ
jgi:anthranilate synthase component 1